VTDSAAGELRGCTAVITGASRGIGRETALKLAEQGVQLVLIARASPDFSRLSDELSRSATTIAAVLANRGDVERTADVVEARIGVPDIVVNNAGAFHIGPLHEISLDDFERSLDVNVLSPFVLARAFLPGMRSRRSGHILTIGSVADRNIFPENAAYAASKFGLRALHEVLRLETRGSGVRTTLISPGPVDTRLWDPINPDSREGYAPRKAMLDPNAVADAIMFALTRPKHVNIEELRLSRS